MSKRKHDTVPIDRKVIVTDVKAKQRKKPKRVIKHSNFVFTINTNQRIGPYEKRLKEFCDQLRDCIDDIFENLHDYVTILEPSHEWSSDFVKKVEAEAEVERGEKVSFDQSSTV
jgi:hypothetical protein